MKKTTPRTQETRLKKAVHRYKTDKSSFVPFSKKEFIDGVSKTRSSG